jgi:dienelactone hydrolase
MSIAAIRTALLVVTLGLAACAQQQQFTGYTCIGWGAANCTPTQVPGEIFAKEDARGLPLVILVHTSGGVTSELRENARRISQQGYVVLILSHYAARSIRESHTAYAQAVSMGANARTMTLDILSAMNGLREDPRIDVSRTVVVGFSAGSITGHWLNSLQFASAHAPVIPQPTTLPRAVIAMYGCPAEFDERMSIRGLPHHFVVGSLDSQLDNCRIYDRMMKERGHTHTDLLVIPNAHHSFDAPYYLQNWPANEEVRRCFAIMHRDGSATNPHTQKTYRHYTYAALMADCATRGEVAGNNGDRWVGFEPMMRLIRRYTDATTAPRENNLRLPGNI